MTTNLLHLEFVHEQTSYIADVRHPSQVTKQDKIRYRISEYSFLVHLFSLKGIDSFELFIDEDAMQWVTNAENLVPYSIVQLLGRKIDAKFS